MQLKVTNFFRLRRSLATNLVPLDSRFSGLFLCSFNPWSPSTRAGGQISPLQTFKSTLKISIFFAIGDGGSGSAFQRLRVRAFDPQSNFASTYIFEKKFNSSEKIFFDRSNKNKIFFDEKHIFLENFENRTT